MRSVGDGLGDEHLEIRAGGYTTTVTRGHCDVRPGY